MALVAGKSGVFAFEHVSGFLVVERLGVPFNEREVFAVVFGVAAGALLARAGGNVIRGMQSLVGIEALGDFGVALQAFEGGLSAELVTTGAVRRSVEGLVRTG